MENPNLQEIAQTLEQLALKVVMLAEDDLPGLGAFLADLEELQAWICHCQIREATVTLDHMIHMGNRLVLQEVGVAAQALELLGQGG